MLDLARGLGADLASRRDLPAPAPPLPPARGRRHGRGRRAWRPSRRPSGRTELERRRVRRPPLVAGRRDRRVRPSASSPAGLPGADRSRSSRGDEHRRAVRRAGTERPRLGVVRCRHESVAARVALRRDAGPVRPGAGAAPRTGSRRSPASTRPGAAPAPGRWSSPPSCCAPGAAGEIPGSPTPSCSPAAPASASTTRVVARAAAWTAVVIPAEEVDRVGLHVSQRRRHAPGARPARRRARLRADRRLPGAGLGVPGPRAVEGRPGVGAASRPRRSSRRSPGTGIMGELHERFPAYDFATHKGYVTAGAPGGARDARAVRRAPASSYVNVARRRRRWRRERGVSAR